MEIGKVQARGQVTLSRHIRRAAGIRPGDALAIEVVGPGELKCTILPRTGVRALWEQYPIEGPIDEPRDRDAWQAAAAGDVLGGRRGS